MKVIKQGRKPEVITKRFICKNCGCIFEASSNEGIRMVETTEHLFRKNTKRYYIPVACPTCYKSHRIYFD